MLYYTGLLPLPGEVVLTIKRGCCVHSIYINSRKRKPFKEIVIFKRLPSPSKVVLAEGQRRRIHRRHNDALTFTRTVLRLQRNCRKEISNEIFSLIFKTDHLRIQSQSKSLNIHRNKAF